MDLNKVVSLLLFISVSVYVLVCNAEKVIVKKVETTTPLLSVETVAYDGFDDTVEIGRDQMKELFSSMLDSYDKRIRPRNDQDMSVKVNSTFHLLNVIEFDTQEQKFSVLGYFWFEWYDDILEWTKEDYSGTNVLRIPVKYIWTPKVVFLKAFDGDGNIGQESTDSTKVYNTGRVIWVPDGIYSVVCEVDISFFPFDVQECSFTYYVADETTDTVEIIHDAQINTTEFTKNSEWDLIGTSNELLEKNGTNYVDLRFKMKRRGGFIMFTVIAPLLMLSFLNGCVFLVPVNSGEKGSFAITVFLSYGIFITIVMETLPHNSLQVSYFVLYIVALLSISVILVFYTIIQSKIFHDFGQSLCKIDCFREKKDVDADGKKTYTWAVFMERLDIWLFFLFMFLVASCSGAFMAGIYYRVQ